MFITSHVYNSQVYDCSGLDLRNLRDILAPLLPIFLLIRTNIIQCLFCIAKLK